jgi:hypothetical protein
MTIEVGKWYKSQGIIFKVSRIQDRLHEADKTYIRQDVWASDMFRGDEHTKHQYMGYAVGSFYELNKEEVKKMELKIVKHKFGL